MCVRVCPNIPCLAQEVKGAFERATHASRQPPLVSRHMNVLVLRDFTLKSKDDIKFEWVIAEAAINPRSGGMNQLEGKHLGYFNFTA